MRLSRSTNPQADGNITPVQLDSLFVRSKVKVTRISDHRDTHTAMTRNNWNFAFRYFHHVYKYHRGKTIYVIKLGRNLYKL